MYDDYGYDYAHDDQFESDSVGRHDSSSYPVMPDIIKKFILHFKDVITNGKLMDKQILYENTFPKLTEQYYDNTAWPTNSDILKEFPDLQEEDHIFLVLYSELTYRHIYARVPGGPTLDQRFESFYHYSALLNWILSSDKPVCLELPDQWLWELIDEFIYQFQSYAQYNARLHQKSPSDIAKLKQSSKIWNVLSILNVLHVFVEKSNIKQQLEAQASGNDPESVAGDFGKHPLYKMLGYFSLIGLLRVHSLLGDYYQAIKVLENIELNKKSQYTDVPACQISTAYYVGFAYMMMRRYADAIRSFTSILLYIQSVKQLFQSRTYQNDQINKQTEKMYHLLAICLVLHPQCIDESIQQVLREKNYHEKMYKMQYGDTSEFESCFMFACPKFVSPGAPDLEGPLEDHSKKALKFQTEVFMAEVSQQKMLPIIRSYLKLYTTLPLSKLATFMSQGVHQYEKDWSLDKEVSSLTTHLLCFKHKMKNVVWVKGPSGLDGSFQSGSELDFYIDGDMVHIADTKVAHRYGDFFIKKILKFEEQNNKLRALKIS